MPFIPNFPPALLEEHMRWHHANHHDDPSQLPNGYGLNFLQFHRQFINKVYQWYNQQGYDPRAIAAWPSVPEVIRNTPCYDQAAEARILYNPRSFANADQLGLFLEGSNLHGCIHQEAARVFGEPALNDFDIAPQSTMFYNIHGMIDQWYLNWENATGNARGAGANKSKSTAIRGARAAQASPAAASIRSRISGAAQASPAAASIRSRISGAQASPASASIRSRISGAAQRGKLGSGALRQVPFLPLIHGAAKRGTPLYSKTSGAGRSRKP